MKKRTLLSIAAALLVTLNAGAFGFETVENAAEASLAETGAALTELFGFLLQKPLLCDLS